MGSIVKSIGKAIKKVGKGLKKIVKKIGPALLVAAAVYAGVAFYGAGSMAGGLGSLSTSNFSAGLTRIGQGIGSFTSGLFNPVGTGPLTGAANVAGGASSLAGSAAVTGGFLETGANTAGSLFGADMGGGSAAVGNSIVKEFVNVSQKRGMTTGDALKYMTRWNMVQTAASMWAASGAGEEASQQAQLNREQEEKLLQMRLDAEKAADEKRYAYGAAQTPEQKEWLTQNPGWLAAHPTTRAPAQTRGLLARGAMPIQQQNIGQPTFGRQAPKNISYSSPSGSPFTRKPQGLIERGTSDSFNPNALRRYT